jgi:folylpolyglutamate synthase
MIRNYKSAIRDLNSLQSNAAAIENIKKNKLIHPSSSLLEMMEFSKKLDINMNNVKVFHVSGTKGKGSTCAFLESLLRLKHKTGLFTSPHLIKVSERIRINGIPVSENMFSHYFYQVWDGLGEPRPSYFKFLTLMAMM